MGKIAKNHEYWSVPEPPPPPKNRGMLVLSPKDMQEAKKSIKEKGINAKDVKNLPPIEKLCEPTTHPPMVEVHSLLDFNASDIPKGKPPDPIEEEEQAVDPNSISTSDAETEDGAEPEKDAEKNDPPEVREEEAPDKRKKHTREEFLARRHGKEQEPWVQKPMPFPSKSVKTKEEEHYNKFCEWMKPLFLQIPLTDAIKLPPYSKYMKDIFTNKRKVPNEVLSTMLANYSFSGKIPEKLGDPGIPTIPCSIKNNYVRTALCDLGAGVSVMPFSLYKRLSLEKLIPTDISLQMADKSMVVPIGICEDVPDEVANCLILTDFVVLDMPEDGSMSIILGRPFLNIAGAVIDCNKGKVTFNVNDKENTVCFPKKIDKRHGLNSIENIETVKIGEWDCPLHVYHKYKTIMVATMSIKVRVQ